MVLNMSVGFECLGRETIENAWDELRSSFFWRKGGNDSFLREH